MQQNAPKYKCYKIQKDRKPRGQNAKRQFSVFCLLCILVFLNLVLFEVRVLLLFCDWVLGSLGVFLMDTEFGLKIKSIDRKELIESQWLEE